LGLVVVHVAATWLLETFLYSEKFPVAVLRLLFIELIGLFDENFFPFFRLKHIKYETNLKSWR